MRRLLLFVFLFIFSVPLVLGLYVPKDSELSTDSTSCYSNLPQNTGKWFCYTLVTTDDGSKTSQVSSFNSDFALVSSGTYHFPVRFYDASGDHPVLDYTISGNCKVDFDADGKISKLSALDDSCALFLSPHLLGVGNMRIDFAKNGYMSFPAKGSLEIKKIASYDFTEYGGGQECKAASRDHGENVAMSLSSDYKDLTITSINEKDKNVFSLFGITFVAVASGDNVVFHFNKDQVKFEVHLDGDSNDVSLKNARYVRDLRFTNDPDLEDKGVTADGYCGHFADMVGIADGAEFDMVKTSDACAQTPTCA